MGCSGATLARFDDYLIGSLRLQDSMRFPRIALLGSGYIGGSAVLAARRAGLVDHVVGYDPDPKATAGAVELGIVDTVAADPEEAVRQASLILLAAPVRAIPKLLQTIAAAVPASATIVDVGSVKKDIVAAAEAVLLAGQFVGCHPMAGAEFSGIAAARADLFPGRLCFLCPCPRTRAPAVDAAHAFWRGVGCQLATVDPDVHDRLMAAQSHLPHVAAFALAAALDSVLPFLEANSPAAPPNTSLRDTTRIAASGPGVWRDIFLANAQHLVPLMDELEIWVKNIRAAVASKDAQTLERVLSVGQAARKRLIKG
jgi:prephenate dehydrogenase